MPSPKPTSALWMRRNDTAASSPTELARDAIGKVNTLRTEFDLLRRELDKSDLGRLSERLAVIDMAVAKLE